MSETRELVWDCDVCGQEVADFDGYVVVDMPTVNRAQAAQADWDAENQPDPTTPKAVSFNDILRMPDRVPWHVYHGACDPDPEGTTYALGTADLRSVKQVLSWTLHFMDTKSWMVHTTWTDLIKKTAGAELNASTQKP